MKGSDIATYTTRFRDLAALCPGMVTLESKKIKRYIWGLPPQIQGNVLSSIPSSFDSAKQLAQRLIDHAACQRTVTPVLEQTKVVDNKRNF